MLNYPVSRGFNLNCRGHLLDLSRPRVMGILNLTPDSFSDGGQYNQSDKALFRVEQMLSEGADIIDIGGYSSRPGAPDISPEEELARVERITSLILQRFPEALISLDTFRTSVARPMLELGVHLINDISAGEGDPAMMELIAEYQVPYILMHMKGTPQTMQHSATYEDVVEEVWSFFVNKVNQARSLGITDLIMDPGFGFGKKWIHNYQLLHRLEQFALLDLPLLVGVSRKSMLYKLFDTTPTDVVELSAVLHFKSLEKGAHILRVHDVKEAARVTQLYVYLQEHGLV